MSSSQRARGLPRFLVPPPIPNINDFSKLFSLRMICPKYDSCIVGLYTDLFVRLAVYGIRSNLVQRHDSTLSIFRLLLSAFLIVHDSQPYMSLLGKLMHFTIRHFVVFVTSLSFHIIIV